MVNAAQTNLSAGQRMASVNKPSNEKGVQINRGLRTLEQDIAEARKNGNPGPAGAQRPQKGVVRNVPPEPPVSSARVQAKPAAVAPTPASTPVAEHKTNYSKELERLAQKYIPEKNRGGTTPTKHAPSGDALKSFEMNKAFNDQLHKERTERTLRSKPPTPEAAPKTEPVVIKEPIVAKPAEPISQVKKEEEKPVEAIRAVKEPPHSPAPTATSTPKVEPKEEFTELTEEDITRELENVLKENKQEKEHSEEVIDEGEKKQEERKVPQSSIKELEEVLADITKRIESSVSRIETYRDEEREVLASLKNLFERRDIINKNLDPIKEKERAILSTIKTFEEREATASNKIEKRDAENKRWENENERRELENERWRLEEIYEKLRLVIEKTEHKQVTIKKKLEEEEKYKRSIESEKHTNETQLNLLTKREEKERVEKLRKQTVDRITNLKSELSIIRSEEEGFEKKKQELEVKIGALSDLTSRRSLEEERRTIEDKRRDTEEKRWAKEDELKKYYAERDERDREINILSTELDSLQKAFEELEDTKSHSSGSDS